jgi:hypothetical protein
VIHAVPNIIHEGGDIYLVPFDMLQMMKMPNDENENSFQPINARHLGKRSNSPMSSKGFGIDEMAELQQSIVDEGWFGNFLCRWVRQGEIWTVQLVAGERRYRSILAIRTKNIPVRDRSKDVRHPETRELLEAGYSPAQEVFKFLRCEIKELDDEEAQTLNILENDKHVGIGERAGIRLVAKMRAWGWDDARILKKLKKSGQWLRDTDEMLNNLGDVCLQAVYDERINRTGAMLLAKITNVKERELILADATHNAWERAKGVVEKRKEEVSKADISEELAEIRLAEAEGKGDEEKIVKALLNLQGAQTDSEKRRAALDTAQKSGQARQRDVRLSIRDIKPRSNRNANVTALRPAKIRKYYAETVKELIDRDGRDENGELVANTADLYLLKEVLDDILFGRTTSLVGRLKARLKVAV